jgi:hypothetical protein
MELAWHIASASEFRTVGVVIGAAVVAAVVVAVKAAIIPAPSVTFITAFIALVSPVLIFPRAVPVIAVCERECTEPQTGYGNGTDNGRGFHGVALALKEPRSCGFHV